MKKQILYLLIICLLGFIIGMFVGFNTNNIDVEIFIKEKTKIETFINTFTINYWYLFIMCILNNSTSIIVNLFILFGKGITLGTMFGILLKSRALFGLGIYLINFIGQFLVLIPLMIIIILFDFKSLQKKLIFVTLVLSIYSFLLALI